MSHERWLEIAEIFSEVTSLPLSEATLCTSCRDVLGVSGAAIALTTDVNVVSFCASDDRVATLEDLQFMLGEGPSRDAATSGLPVLEHNLLGASPACWPALTSPALEAGVSGIFAFPLRIGAAHVGVLTLYEDRSIPLSREQLDDALISADVLTHVILSGQAEAPSGSFATLLARAATYHAEMHQASGMVSEQAGISIAEALIRMRGHAYATGMPIVERLAAAVVARRIRLERVDSVRTEWIEER